MAILARKRRGVTMAFVLSLAGLTGCGVVYEAQEFSESSLTYGYKGDFEAPIELIPLTFTSVRAANADGYSTRGLPQVFDAIEPLPDISVRERLAATGLDQIQPPLTFETPSPFPRYDGAREVLQPGQRNANLTPLPTYDINGNPLDPLDGGFAGNGPRPADLDPITPLDPITYQRQVRSNPLPSASPPLYKIGPGDVISLQSRARALPTLDDFDIGNEGGAQRLLVQDNGEIFIPEAGAVQVAGLTLSEARSRIDARLVESQIGVDAGVEIIEFGSKRIAVSGLSGNQLIPITVRPTTLGEAITLSGGLGSNPENMIVRVLRDGVIYEMSGPELAGSGQLSSRILLDQDIISVVPAYDVELALRYFDQQLRVRELERSGFADEISQRADARAVQAGARDRLRLQIQRENYRLEAERLRQQAEIDRLTAQRDADKLNEEARLANITARQAYLDRLRTLERDNREDLRLVRSETRAILTANQAERARERAELRELLELELREERFRLERKATERKEARALFSERVRLGAEQQDYVTIAGEIRQQTTVPLPFEGTMTLNRVIYENNNGVDPVTGNSSEIYVFRVPSDTRINDRLIAYHLDASNPVALAVASQFEMRPNDVVYVNPQPITKWNRVLTQILPSTGLLQSGLTAVTGN